MSHRDFAFVAVGRFLAVERYRETQLSSPTHRPWSAGPDRTGGHADKSGAGSGSRGAGSAAARVGER
jgi:hypothetical protein